MIYDPVTRQSLEIVGKYPEQKHAYDQFVGKIKGNFRFVKARYGEHLAGFSGGFPVGYERDLDLNSMVADYGSLEIQKAYDAAPLLESA